VKAVDQLVQLLRALAEPTRLRLLACLKKRSACVCELSEALGLSQTQASRHLGVLKQAGLVQSERSSQRVNYHYTPPEAGTPAAQLVEATGAWLEELPEVALDRQRCAEAQSKACAGSTKAQDENFSLKE